MDANDHSLVHLVGWTNKHATPILSTFDTKSGDTLWQYTLPVDATATPMTYMYRGRQYVVINAGGHHMFQRGQGDYLYAFALPTTETTDKSP